MAEPSSGPPTRPTLLRRLRNSRDQEAWQTFKDVYGPLIYDYCRRRGLQEADAQDLTQEVLFRVSQSMQRFDYQPERGHFRAWLGKLVRNELWRFLKNGPAEIPAQEIKPVDEETTELDPEWVDTFQQHLLRTALMVARSKFEENTWHAFERQWQQGHPPAEVARDLGMSIEAVYMAKARVLKRLQQEVLELAEDSIWFAR